MDEREIAFEDGNISGAVRVGTTVRRTMGPWSPAVHAVLRHLEAVGFEYAPRVLGVDDRGREILTYIEGQTSADPRVSFASDEALGEIARILRGYHDAITGFEPSSPSWRFLIGAPRTGEVICHNDFAPYNVITDRGRIMALIDWDFAAPAPREWDIAHALWRFVPLYDDAAFGSAADQARRARVFCDAYGLDRRAELLATIEWRQRTLYDSVAAWAAAGDPAFVALWRRGDAAAILRDMAYLRRYRCEFQHHLV